LLVSTLLQQTLPPKTLAVAVDAGELANRLGVIGGEQGLIGQPVSLPFSELASVRSGGWSLRVRRRVQAR
jgi:hypothetical protein